MINMKNKKIILIVAAIVLLTLVTAGVTLAFFGWEGTESTIDVSVSSGTGSCTFVSDNEVLLAPTASKTNGRIIKMTANQQMAGKAYITWELVVNEISDLKHESFTYELINTTTGVSYGTGNFANITTDTGSNTITFKNNKEKLDYNKDYEFALYLWIDGEKFTNPTIMADQEFNFDMSCSITGTGDEPTLTTHISNLYTNAEKTIVTNNSITYNYAKIYDTDTDATTSGGLMNDRLGGTTTDYDAGNIRYYGANPSNYIDIGDTEINSDGKEVPTLYRIIGVFKDVELEDGTTKDLVKVIRNGSIGNYSWDTSASNVNGGYGINEWSQADLMKLLNPGYNSETVGGSLYWNSESGTCYLRRLNATTSCDFKTKKEGLSTEVQEKIVSVVWNLGGHNPYSVYSNQIYGFERGENVVKVGTTCSGAYCNDSVTRTTKWPGKVALMYPSDYGYATDLSSSACSSNLYNYSDSTNSYGCRSNDWLYNSSINQFTLSPNSSNAYDVFNVLSSGRLHSSDYSYGTSGVRPVFYLDSELIIKSGSGTKGNPYVVE